MSHPSTGTAPAAPSERFQRGLAKLTEVDGAQGQRVVDSLQDVAPELGTLLIESFGDFYGRPGLDLKTRELATVAALTALGTATPQLKVHIHAALHVGCTRAQIIEVMMQMVLYAGYPAALNGVFAARDVFAAGE